MWIWTDYHKYIAGAGLRIGPGSFFTEANIGLSRKGRGDMVMKANRSMAAQELWKGIIWGISVSAVATLAGTAIMSGLIMQETITEIWIGYCAMTVLLLSSVLGVWVGIRKQGRNNFVAALGISAAYFSLLLFLNAALFGASYEGVGVTLLIILGGGIATYLAAGRKSKPKHKPGRKFKHG